MGWNETIINGACLTAGSLSFVLMGLFDWKKAKKKKGAVWFFAAGMLLLAASTVCLTLRSMRLPMRMHQWAGLALAVFFAALYCYVLFFALPSSEIYRSDECASDGRASDDRTLEDGDFDVCRSGVYGWCRHPGVWCFCLLYLALAVMTDSVRMSAAALLFCAENFLYVCIQDRWLFPMYIGGYRQYQKEVPFLIPSKRKK